MTLEDGIIRCSQDALPEYAKLFNSWQPLGDQGIENELRKQSQKIYDMYKRWTYVNTSGDRTQYCCTYNPSVEFNPMTQSEVILPDPVQQKIAEHLLKRELTEDEYYGIVKVPLINENGERYYGQIQQLVFPRDYGGKSKSKKYMKPNQKFPVIIDWDEENE